MDLKPGDVIDTKYTVDKELGRGGMGVVYRALHRDLGTHVALKFLKAALATDATQLQRFRTEARIGSRLKSHHVVRVHDVGTHAGAHYIVMEHLTGSDLGAVLEERGPLALKECAELVLEACEAVHEAHLLGIVHRDLKPTNLFVTDGPDGLKVLDFGISKSPYAEEAAKTGTYTVVGSAHYMSPEQLTASRAADARTDVWALAVILYQVLGDTVPFAGASMVDVHEAIRKGVWTRLSEHCPGLPPAIDTLVANALERDREKRTPTVLAFAEQLAPFGGERAKQSLERMRRLGNVAGLETPKTEDATPPRSPGRPMRTAALGLLTCAAIGAGLGVRERLSSVPIAPTPQPSGSAPVITDIAPVAPAPSASAPTPPPSASVAMAPAPVAPVLLPPAPTRAKSPCAGGPTPECEAACQANATGACEALAIALVHAKGAARAPARAAELYKAACDAGSMSACNALGALNASGDGVTKDPGEAAKLYGKACHHNFALACVNLGSMELDASSPLKDPEDAVRLFELACDWREPSGCKNLAHAYRTNVGIGRNLVKAEQAEAKAAELMKASRASGH